ncbi:MAG: hypothetical protein JO251_23445 [Verrucomicrobia bacterium]|nr:hypothetical protein [Verrucomicrobiota bacterium]MBV8640759.1 hypothetical protein [Verrucomicrobiota bacterium]
MPDPVLYVLPEDHNTKGDQARKKTLVEFAYCGAINVLLEGSYFHDNSGHSANLYGIEEEKSHKGAMAIVNYQRAVRNIKDLQAKLKSAAPSVPAELASARNDALNEVSSLAKEKTRRELAQYINLYPALGMNTIQEKYLFYKRNHRMANNIRTIVQTVLADPQKPRVFALSIGAFHIDSTNLNPGVLHNGRKDLPTTLGYSITVGAETVEVKYGDQSLTTIAKTALGLIGNVPWTTRWMAQARLKLYISTTL